jgi:hypothetical protein
MTLNRSRGAGAMVLVMSVAACTGPGADSSPTGSSPPVVASAAPAESATATPTTSGNPSTTAGRPAPAATTTTTPPSPPLRPADQALAAQVAAVRTVVGEATCDPLDSRRCLLPYPSNFFTRLDPSSDTGRRVEFAPSAMPANASGVAIDPGEWNRNDGFSPNSTILTSVPGLDPVASALPGWDDPAASLDEASPVAVLDMTTGARVAAWAELDAKAEGDERLLIVHPAIALPEGHRIAVALRSLISTAGAPIEPGPVFRLYRDRLTVADDMAIEARRPAMEEMFASLKAAGVDRDGLVLAWDFTVISQRNLSERMLHIRDQTLEFYGGSTPEFTVTSITDAPPDAVDDGGLIARQIVGTYTVPNFLTGDGGPGSRFFLSPGVKATPDWLPAQNGLLEVGFVCNVPASVTRTGNYPVHLVQYGHGLLGSEFEIDAGNVRRMANEHDVIFCATKWAGMSEDDIGNAAATLGEMGNFPTMADRLQQGVLNQIALGRLMLTYNGLMVDRAVDIVKGKIDRAHLDYDGNSQGGIMGLMLAAVSTDIERAVVGVPGINYSLLLPRSVDFDDYEAVFKPAYPNDLDRTLVISLIQMLWDRGEGGGYVQHLTGDPYPLTEAKTVLLDVALGDHQVTPLSALIAARTLGVSAQLPLTAPGRLPPNTAWGLDALRYPSDGSAIIFWDSGAEPMPVENLPPRAGNDPHEDPRADVDVRRQKAAFLFEDQLIDVCAGSPCTADRAP